MVPIGNERVGEDVVVVDLIFDFDVLVVVVVAVGYGDVPVLG